MIEETLGAYPTASVESGSDGSVVQGDEGGDVGDVLVCTAGREGATAGEVELLPAVLDPFLDGFLDGEFFVRGVGVPGVVAALGPGEGVLVAWGRGDEAAEELVLLRAVALAVLQVGAGELDRAHGILAGRVLAVLHVARRELLDLGAVAGRALGAVVRSEVQHSRGRRAIRALPAHHTQSAAVLPRTQHVEEAAEPRHSRQPDDPTPPGMVKGNELGRARLPHLQTCHHKNTHRTITQEFLHQLVHNITLNP
jgi:hypothetical protein